VRRFNAALGTRETRRLSLAQSMSEVDTIHLAIGESSNRRAPRPAKAALKRRTPKISFAKTRFVVFFAGPRA